MSGIYLVLGVNPPVFDAAGKQTPQGADRIGIVPFDFKTIDNASKDKLLARRTEDEKLVLSQLIKRLNAITPTLKDTLDAMPEKMALRSAGEAMLNLCGGKLKFLCADNGSFPVKAPKAAQALLEGNLDLGDKLESYLKHISPAVKKILADSDRKFPGRLPLEPELQEFQKAHDAYHGVRRQLAEDFNAVTGEGRTIKERTRGNNIGLIAALSLLSKRGLIDSDVLPQLSKPVKAQLSRMEAGGPGAAGGM